MKRANAPFRRWPFRPTEVGWWYERRRGHNFSTLLNQQTLAEVPANLLPDADRVEKAVE